MNNFRLGLFDIFGYTIPGFCYLVLISLSINLYSLNQILNLISSLTTVQFFACFFVSFLIGFFFDGFALKYVTVVMDKINKGKLKDRVLDNFRVENPNARIDNYYFAFIYAFADIVSQNTREKADSLIALSNMSRNLSLGFLVYAMISLFHGLIYLCKTNWLLLSIKIILAIIISYTFLSYADRLKFISHSHLLNAYFIILKKNEIIKKAKS